MIANTGTGKCFLITKAKIQYQFLKPILKDLRQVLALDSFVQGCKDEDSLSLRWISIIEIKIWNQNLQSKSASRFSRDVDPDPHGCTVTLDPNSAVTKTEIKKHIFLQYQSLFC